MVAPVVVAAAAHTPGQAVLETRLTLRPPKATTVETALGQQEQALMAVAAAAVHLLLAQTEVLLLVATVVPVQPHQYLAEVLPMLAAAAAEFLIQQRPLAVAAQAVAEQAAMEFPGLLEHQEPQTPEAAVVAAVLLHQTSIKAAALAAPVLSSSSTTSALPRSSPSSHRRSGLHQRVR
jgi:hypothetical protein